MTNIFFPRIANDGSDRGARVLTDELYAGKRAPYHVYYRKNGKLMVDAAYCATPQEATDRIKKWVKKAEILGVVSTILSDAHPDLVW